MSGAHFHLIVNHVPVLGAVFCLMALAWALWWKDWGVQRFSMACLVLLGGSSVLAYVTGEPAEEVVESIATVSHDYIERHEDAAWIALWSGMVCGLVGVVGLILRAEKARQMMTYLALAVSVLCLGLMIWTANLGGMVRHTEIRPEAASSMIPSVRQPEDD